MILLNINSLLETNATFEISNRTFLFNQVFPNIVYLLNISVLYLLSQLEVQNLEFLFVILF